MKNDPSDYYRNKDQTAHLLVEVLEKLRELQKLDRWKYDDIIAELEGRLELARYLGD